MMFGEFYPPPGSPAVVPTPLAMGAEALGAWLLVTLVFALTEGCNVGRPDDTLAPVFVGLAVCAIIGLVGPLTQAGLNPARDLGPRLVAWLAGWGEAAFPDRRGGFLLVYVLAPLLGGAGASLFFVRVLEPSMLHATAKRGCGAAGAGCGKEECA
jgi:glycerol uptake facilitator protein